MFSTSLDLIQAPFCRVKWKTSAIVTQSVVCDSCFVDGDQSLCNHLFDEPDRSPDSHPFRSGRFCKRSVAGEKRATLSIRKDQTQHVVAANLRVGGDQCLGSLHHRSVKFHRDKPKLDKVAVLLLQLFEV